MIIGYTDYQMHVTYVGVLLFNKITSFAYPKRWYVADVSGTCNRDKRSSVATSEAFIESRRTSERSLADRDPDSDAGVVVLALHNQVPLRTRQRCHTEKLRHLLAFSIDQNFTLQWCVFIWEMTQNSTQVNCVYYRC